MDYLTLLIADLPNGFWQNIIGYFVDFVGSYGFAIILFSIALKLVLSPMDFMQRKMTKQNMEKQAILKPKLEKLNKKYANNKELLNQKTMELYKKENYNIIGTCLGMLVNLVLTLVIFIGVFSAMRNISEYKIVNQYENLKNTYDVTYAVNSSEAEAQQAVLDEYKEIKDSFLWVSNIWMPDTLTNVIPSYDRYLSIGNVKQDEAPTEAEYNEVMGVLQQEYQGWNGYFILIILAGVVTYLSQKVLTKNQPKPTSPADEENPMPQLNGKFMQVLLPALMIIFTLSYSAAFALYIVMNSIMTLIIAIISNKIVDSIKNKKENTNKADYVR